MRHILKIMLLILFIFTSCSPIPSIEKVVSQNVLKSDETPWTPPVTPEEFIPDDMYCSSDDEASPEELKCNI